MNGQPAAAGSFFTGLLQNQMFWEGAFIVALILLIGAHKITIEGRLAV
jgi:hypothetical protein